MYRTVTFSVLVIAVLLCGTPYVEGAPDWVDASTYGYNAEDATAALQNAINSGAATVYVPDMGTPWIIRPVFLNSSNQEILFEEGVVVLAREGFYLDAHDSLFEAVGKTNIRISGYGVTFRMRREDYASLGGEWRHGIRLWSCEDVTIEGIEIENTGGDGIYVGRPGGGAGGGPPCRNIAIRDVICEDNYRQGISVIDVENLLIEDSIFRTTSGTNPQAGIDFEPDLADDVLTNITVRNCIFDSNAARWAGVFFYLPIMSNPTATSGSMENCTIISNGNDGIRTSHYLPHFTFKNNLIVNNAGYGMLQTSGGLGTWISYTAFWGNASGTVYGVNTGAGVITDVEPVFASTQISDPTYMYLAEECPDAILTGADDGGFLGARGLAPETPAAMDYGSASLLYLFNDSYSSGGVDWISDYSGNCFDAKTNVAFGSYWELREADPFDVSGNQSVFANTKWRTLWPQANPLSDIYDGATNAWTVEGYARTASPNMATNRFCVLGFGGATHYPDDQVQTVKVGWAATDATGARGTVEFFDGSDAHTLVGLQAFGSTAFHHIAATYDGSTIKLYVDGILNGSVPVGANMLPLSRVVLMVDDVDQYWGYLDDFRFSYLALDAEELGYGSPLVPPSFGNGDANRDKVVNLLDFAVLSSNWGLFDACWVEGDFTGDGNVGLPDLGILSKNWQAGY